MHHDLSLFCLKVLGGRARCRNHGPYPTPAGKVERHQCKRLDILARAQNASRSPQIPVEHVVGCRTLTMMDEIHQQKGEIIEGIDGCHLVAELQRIKQRRLTLPDDDVGQVQVAMAPPESPLANPRLQQARGGGAGGPCRTLESVDVTSGKNIGALPADFTDLLNDGAHLGWCIDAVGTH